MEKIKNKVYFLKSCSIFVVMLRPFPAFLERFEV